VLVPSVTAIKLLLREVSDTMDAGSLRFRTATSADVESMERARAPDHEAGPADSRMARYLDGDHHPQKALPCRNGVASELLRLLAGWFGGQGVSRVCVGVDEDNAGARSFLAHHGAQKLNNSFLKWPEIDEVLARR